MKIVTKFSHKECIITLVLKTVHEQCKKQTNCIEYALLTGNREFSVLKF